MHPLDYAHRAPEDWQVGVPVILFSLYPIVRESVIGSAEGRLPYLAADLTLGERTLTVVACTRHLRPKIRAKPASRTSSSTIWRIL